MFGLGSKKPPSLDRFPTDNWAVSTGECDGQPLIARINAGCRKYVGHPELTCRLGVTITFRSPDERGFPSKEEQVELNNFEDQLCERLQGEMIGFSVLVITTGGRRELVFHVGDRERASAIVDQVRDASPCQAVYGFEDDPDWTYFSQLAQ